MRRAAPTPNHSHVVDNSRVNTGPGTSGITSASAMDAAEAAGRAIEVGSNFFLFFSSQLTEHAMAHQH